MHFSAKYCRSPTSCTHSAFAICCGQGTKLMRIYETWKLWRISSTKIFPPSFEGTWRLWSSVSSSSTARSPSFYTCTTRTHPNNHLKARIKRIKQSPVLKLKSIRTASKGPVQTVPKWPWTCATHSGFSLIATLEAVRPGLKDAPIALAPKTFSQLSKRASRTWISHLRAPYKAAITF